MGYILLVTFDHWSKSISQKLQSKTLIKNTTLRLVKKTILVILDLLKLTCPKKLKGFFYACHFGVYFDLKTWFEKPRILVVCLERLSLYSKLIFHDLFLFSFHINLICTWGLVGVDEFSFTFLESPSINDYKKWTFDALHPFWVKKMKYQNVCCCIYHVELEKLKVGFNRMWKNQDYIQVHIVIVTMRQFVNPLMVLQMVAWVHVPHFHA